MVGNGLSINAWEDKWLELGHLSRFLSYRIIHSRGFTKLSTVADVVNSIQCWPPDWVDRCSDLNSTPLPALYHDVRDHVMWINRQDVPVPFRVSEVWRTFDGQHNEVGWHKMCWFSKHVPKHSFCLWLAFRLRLPTQDRMQNWCDDVLVCSLCNQGMDSHNHLFFECTFSASVWSSIKADLQDSNIPNVWDDILEAIIHKRWQPNDFRKKIVFAATVYFIWQERNNRLFSDKRRTPDQLLLEIKKVVFMRFAGLGVHVPTARRDRGRRIPSS